jgi:hypothetical protein
MRPDGGHGARRRSAALHFTAGEARSLGLHVPRRPRQTTDFPRRRGVSDHCSFLFNVVSCSFNPLISPYSFLSNVHADDTELSDEKFAKLLQEVLGEVPDELLSRQIER